VVLWDCRSLARRPPYPLKTSPELDDDIQTIATNGSGGTHVATVHLAMGLTRVKLHFLTILLGIYRSFSAKLWCRPKPKAVGKRAERGSRGRENLKNLLFDC
jgi:hypothetical protein